MVNISIAVAFAVASLRQPRAILSRNDCVFGGEILCQNDLWFFVLNLYVLMVPGACSASVGVTSLHAFPGGMCVRGCFLLLELKFS